MAAFLIASVLVKDDKWIPDYAARVHDIAAKHGGKYLSRSGNIDVLEGKPQEATLIALIQFPNKEAAKAFGQILGCSFSGSRSSPGRRSRGLPQARSEAEAFYTLR